MGELASSLGTELQQVCYKVLIVQVPNNPHALQIQHFVEDGSRHLRPCFYGNYPDFPHGTWTKVNHWTRTSCLDQCMDRHGS